MKQFFAFASALLIIALLVGCGQKAPELQYAPDSEQYVFFKSLIASAVMAAFIYSLPATLYNTHIKLLLSIVLSSLVYFVVLYIFKGITKEDLQSLINK